jgi:hypothetical protein
MTLVGYAEITLLFIVGIAVGLTLKNIVWEAKQIRKRGRTGDKTGIEAGEDVNNNIINSGHKNKVFHTNHNYASNSTVFEVYVYDLVTSLREEISVLKERNTFLKKRNLLLSRRIVHLEKLFTENNPHR